MNHAFHNLRRTLLGFVFFRFRHRLFFAENPGADNAEFVHEHQRDGHHDLGDHIRRGQDGGAGKKQQYGVFAVTLSKVHRNNSQACQKS